MIDTIPFFTEALDLRGHPICKAKEKTRVIYFQALSYIVYSAIESSIQEATEKVISNETLQGYVSKRLNLYYELLHISKKELLSNTDTQKKEQLHSLSVCTTVPWRYKLRYRLLCDVALILLDPALIEKASSIEKLYLSKRVSAKLDIFTNSLYDSSKTLEKFSFAESLVKQYQANSLLSQAKPYKLIITANMSAGKSTLINALIGKAIARTSQEACTGNICYLYNKAFEDNHIALTSPEVTLDASNEELTSYLWHDEISIASYFTGVKSIHFPVCIIDTPGVNAAIYKEHSKIACKALKEQDYDKLIYVVSPTNLGTDAEIKHLKWIAENTSKEKVIFVINKADNFHCDSDNISESVNDLKKDLSKLGFESPIICPLSAYFGFLLKMKITNQELSEDEKDEYTILAKKFGRPKYDLSGYYDGSQVNANDNEEIKLCKQSGLYGLEKTIYGGNI